MLTRRPKKSKKSGDYSAMHAAGRVLKSDYHPSSATTISIDIPGMVACKNRSSCLVHSSWFEASLRSISCEKTHELAAESASRHDVKTCDGLRRFGTPLFQPVAMSIYIQNMDANKGESNFKMSPEYFPAASSFFLRPWQGGECRKRHTHETRTIWFALSVES